MKGIMALAVLVALAAPASAQYYGQQQQRNPYGGTTGGYGSGTGSNSNSHYVNPYVTNQGTMGGGYHRTNPNSTQMDNYGARGNTNPWSGQTGTQRPRW